MTAHLILASASPARHRTLAAAGIDARVIVSGVDESVIDVTEPDLLSLTLARMKAEAVADSLHRDQADGALVLGCDSVLGFGGEVFGKPVDAAEATARWRRMRGAEGVLYTGHCLIAVATGKIAQAVAAATVRFAEVTDEEIDAYVESGEPMEVAGAFKIDGIGGAFVESIDGDPGTVIGLSLPLLRRLLAELGTPIISLWRGRQAPASLR